MTVFLAEIGYVRASSFEDPQAQQAEHFLDGAAARPTGPGRAQRTRPGNSAGRTSPTASKRRWHEVAVQICRLRCRGPSRRSRPQ